MINTQKQEDLQLLRQKQDLVSCNNSFGMLLSSMESLFVKSGYNINIQFEHYNYFQNRNWKTKQQIKEQIYTDLMAYKISKMAYKQKYGKFDYPDYPPIDKIIDIVIQWKERANDPEEKQLSQEILDLILDENTKPISYYQSRIEKTGLTSSHVDATEQFQLANKIHDKIDKRNEEIKEKLQENPDAKFGLEIGNQVKPSEYSHIKIPYNYQNFDNTKSALETSILHEVEGLIKSFESFNDSALEYYYNLLNRELQDYHAKYQNIEFIYRKFKINNFVNAIDYKIKYNNMSEVKKKLLFKIKTLFDKFDYY